METSCVHRSAFPGHGREVIAFSLILTFRANCSHSASDLYAMPIIQALVNDYITSNELINPHEQAYINLDDALRKCVLSNPTAKKSKDKEKESQPDADFMKRDELHRKVLERMQPWYEVSGEGRDAVVK